MPGHSSMKLLNALLIACQLGFLPLVAHAELSPESAAKNLPVVPFRMVGEVYYVGASDVASYLVKTSAGLVLIDAGFAETAPQIENNIRTLGFKLGDVKILLLGHAHPDHVGGLAALERDTGAQVAAMTEEVLPLENNGRGTFYRGDRRLFESVKVGRVLHDGDKVALGGVVLVAHHTPGHTPGCTTWTLKTSDHRHAYNVVFFCQLTSPEGEALTKNPDYPNAVSDFKGSFEALRKLPCDVPLAEHGTAFHLTDKLRRRVDNSANPFVDPAGCRDLVDVASKEFDEALRAPPSAQAKDDSLPPDLAKAAAEYDQAQIKSDGEALRRLLADDYALVNAAAEISDKAAFIADSTQAGSTIQPFVVMNPINRVWADGAVLSGEVNLKGTSDGKAFEARMRFADIWRKRDGRWQVVFTEVTRLPVVAHHPQ